MGKRNAFLHCVLLLLLVTPIAAGERIPDIVFFDGELYHLHNSFPFDLYLAGHKLYPRHTDAPMMVTRRGQMDGTDNPNFHIASWVVKDRQLFLAGIEGFVYHNFDSWYLESIEKSLEAASSEEEKKRLQSEITSLRQSGINPSVISAMDHFFPRHKRGELILAQWYSGQLILEKQTESFPSRKRKRYEITFYQGRLTSIREL